MYSFSLCLNSDFFVHIGYSTPRKVASDTNNSATILKQNKISVYHKAVQNFIQEA